MVLISNRYFFVIWCQRCFQSRCERKQLSRFRIVSYRSLRIVRIVHMEHKSFRIEGLAFGVFQLSRCCLQRHPCDRNRSLAHLDIKCRRHARILYGHSSHICRELCIQIRRERKVRCRLIRVCCCFFCSVTVGKLKHKTCRIEGFALPVIQLAGLFYGNARKLRLCRFCNFDRKLSFRASRISILSESCDDRCRSSRRGVILVRYDVVNAVSELRLTEHYGDLFLCQGHRMLLIHC